MEGEIFFFNVVSKKNVEKSQALHINGPFGNNYQDMICKGRIQFE
jgi:hypothetical protein